MPGYCLSMNEFNIFSFQNVDSKIFPYLIIITMFNNLIQIKLTCSHRNTDLTLQSLVKGAFLGKYTAAQENIMRRLCRPLSDRKSNPIVLKV